MKIEEFDAERKEYLSNVMDKYLDFVRKEKPTMVNHGEKINLFELEQLINKFKLKF